MKSISFQFNSSRVKKFVVIVSNQKKSEKNV